MTDVEVQAMMEMLQRAGIYPDVIPMQYDLPNKSQEVKMTISYSIGHAMSGRILTPEQAKNPPEVRTYKRC